MMIIAARHAGVEESTAANKGEHPQAMASCTHHPLHLDVSPCAGGFGYERPSVQRLLGATRLSGRPPSLAKARTADSAAVDIPPDSTFPAPLVVPGDELAFDPGYPPQSLRSWKQLKERNVVTNRRRTIYVLPPPKAIATVDHVDKWASPQGIARPIEFPAVEDVVDYLQAFYHGLPVKVLHKPKLHFAKWHDGARKKVTPKPDGARQCHDLALQTGSEAIRIRVRKYDTFPAQLNLNDLLDAAISILPEDAYALLMIVNQDLYEDEEDDFCCGRAYGGSRVAVVSTARYNPGLDEGIDLDRHHAWPASHCKRYIQECCDQPTKRAPKAKRQKVTARQVKATQADDTATSSAVAAHTAHPISTVNTSHSRDQLRVLWLGRVCKTAMHELGHCFGIDHCTYYACIMQGTAGLSEDARQPPYVCPVDTAKLLTATGADEVDWLRALLGFCERFGEDALFSAFAAWLRVRLVELDA
ncbi:hypothetical protein LTR59_007086 [Friedmanniomyces endolithicus]|nr:hypothetical protein LTR94_002077 [Friedmanniomyces endolithicus]KAK0796605.1 hypothetical protein LTR59_007086 [Friedmanniomyces endolithicus]KAK0819778.1 hypothetical protein LTR38_000532 [Friedmanniomyces endolithicus]KAK0821981.1 hypothetical protein LTR75_000115 [Friedmanniomyces endolithicus]KAK0845927.1 hypothetical protein LTR03_007133 [Friedmanniomyces endolithicus]